MELSIEQGDVLATDQNPVQNFDGANQAPVAQTHIFNLLPENWDDIFPHLTCQDFLSLINACLGWRELFKAHTTSQLWPLVLPILLNHHENLSRNDLLNLRLVSRQIKAAIDDILVESPQTYYENVTTQGTEWSSWVQDKRHPLRGRVESIKNRYAYYADDIFDKFIAKYSEFGRVQDSAPFISRCLTIALVNITNINPVFQNLNRHSTNMLMTLGHTVSSVHFDGLLGITVSHLYTLLNHLPNLMILTIRGVLYPGQEEALRRGEPPLSLNKLELLNIEYGMDSEEHGNQMGQVCASILRSCSSQLTRLICASFLFRNEATVGAVVAGHLQYLRALRVRAVNDETFPNVLATLSLLNHLPLLEDLQLCGRSDEDTISIGDVLQIVNIFASTLANFQLNTVVNIEPDMVLERDDNGTMIPLDKLTKFSTLLTNIEMDWFWPFLQVKCQNLRQLHLSGTVFHESYTDGIRRAFGLLPKLRKVVLFCGFKLMRECKPEMIVFGRDGTTRKQKFRTPL